MSTSETFGRYRVGAALGQGGMASVHEAWIEGPDGFSRRVALKRVRRDAEGTPQLLELFSDEARIASHLHHANLVGILDYGVEGGVPFQALELVEGTTLEALREDLDARGEPLPEAIAIHVAREVAHGLAYAHRATGADGKLLGLVHRDVSPSNVLVGWNGDVKLSDFGIAFARGRQIETAHGVARGKPSYMAPEQATRGTIDARTDLFGLGCTLHFALTGRSPLQGDEVLLKMLVGERAPLDPRLASDLAEIIAAAVAPERRERPASADAMNERLDVAYRARSSRDGKMELRTWIAPIAKRRTSTSTSTSTSSSTSTSTSSSTSTSTSPAPAPTTAPTTAPAPSRWLVPLAAVALLALALTLGTTSAHDDSALPTTTPLAPPIDATAPADDAAARAPDAATPAPDTSTPAPEATIAAPALTRASHPAIAHASDDDAPRPPPVRETGWLRVVAGCEDARGGAVELDGHTTGDHVPMTTRLPAGTHRVAVTAPDGRRFDGSVDISAFHTEGQPAWFRACAGP